MKFLSQKNLYGIILVALAVWYNPLEKCELAIDIVNFRAWKFSPLSEKAKYLSSALTVILFHFFIFLFNKKLPHMYRSLKQL